MARIRRESGGRQATRREFLEIVAASAFAGSGTKRKGTALQRSGAREGKARGWLAHPVASVPEGYMVAAADVNSDGRPDILALSSEKSIVAWYENPSWRARMITTDTRNNIALAPLFQPGYPVAGIALASDFSLAPTAGGGRVWWAPKPAEPAAPWALSPVAQIHSAHRLRWADLDGDGRLELVVAPILGPRARPPDYAVGAPLTWLEMPPVLLEPHATAAERAANVWAAHRIDDSLTVIHGLLVFDWNGDGRDELLTASFEGVHLFESSGRGEKLRWKKTRLAAGDQISRPRRGASEIGVGRLAEKRFLATIEPWHGNQVVVYTPPERKPRNALWDRHVIDASFKSGHALACADLDGDGNDEIVAGYRGPGTSLFIYKARDASGTRWARQTLDTEMAASCAVIADINGDGRPDIIAIGSSTAKVKWYENLGSRL